MEKDFEKGYFDTIRPFNDDEVQAAIARLLDNSHFRAALNFVFPSMDANTLEAQLRSINSVDEFQAKIISNAVAAIIHNSTTGLHASGLEKLHADKGYLCISNHRDIVLDSAFLNYLLFKQKLPTTRIAIGSNLLQAPWIEDLVKLNKNFIVNRNVQPRQAYEYSLLLSRYIRFSIESDLSSVWIAQKEGRSKDGIDQTQTGLLKMLGMSSDEGASGYEKLNIVPVSISYEFEPCAGLKAQEIFMKSQNGSYQKAEGEDVRSMQLGIVRPKGNVHFHFSEPLSKESIQNAFQSGNRNEAMKLIAEEIDKEIIKNYQLFPNNFIAFDLVNHSETFIQQYTLSDKEVFERYLNEELDQLKGDRDALKIHLLHIYMNPLIRKMNFGFLNIN
jgi:glycerol-3-phosphate O-acyltransferase